MSKKRTGIFSIMVFLLCLIIPGIANALAVCDVPFEEMHPDNTRQRSLAEIQELPVKNTPCPVCDFSVAIPLVDALMLKPESGPKPKWRMDADRRDTDFCPYPAEGKVFWQADVVICPGCGYAAEADEFANPVSEEAKEWVRANLTPALHEAQADLLGWRRGEMTEGQVAEFFNKQGEIPDELRLEHWVTCLDGMHAPTLKRAKAGWRSAWAFRRRLLSTPKSEIFVRHAALLQKDLAEAELTSGPHGPHGDVDAMRALLRRKRAAQRDALPGAMDMTGRLLLAGLWDRHGVLGEAEELLRGLYNECRERFLRPEQDPLWPETSTRASRTHRLNELELMRTDAEREVLMRLELVRGEKSRLLAASELIRQAIREGEMDGEPEAALFHAYLVGEFLRRGGDLPLAFEWLKLLISLAGEDTPLGVLAAEQLGCVREEAGDRVNLLSALGKDGELFSRLREICKADR